MFPGAAKQKNTEKKAARNLEKARKRAGTKKQGQANIVPKPSPPEKGRKKRTSFNGH